MGVTAVIPAVGDHANLPTLVAALQKHVDHIVVSLDEASPMDCQLAADVEVVRGTRGRGAQIARGISVSTTSLVWVLHADSRLNADVLTYVAGLSADEPCWGRFDVHLPGLALIGFMMNWRSRLTRICTGDQGMFFHKDVLNLVGGFPDLPLMEDIEVSRRLKRQRQVAFFAPSIKITTSPRRWQEHGVLRTVLNMWWVRAQYFAGVPADNLYRQYYQVD